MKVLITGSRGQLGHHLQELLKDKHVQCVATDVDELDITDFGAVEKFVAKHKPTHMINAAAYNGVDQAEKEIAIAFAINSAGPWNLALAARKHGCVFVHISTDFVFDGTKKSAYVETDLPNPQSAYARSKYAGELLVQNAAGKYFILRTAWLYGDVGTNFPTVIIESARAGRALSVVKDQIGCPTYAKDLAEAIIALAQTSSYGLYHGVNKGSTSWYSFARAILQETGLDATVRPQTTKQYLESAGKVVAARPQDSVLTTHKLQKESGYTFRPWQAALRDWAQTRMKNRE